MKIGLAYATALVAIVAACSSSGGGGNAGNGGNPGNGGDQLSQVSFAIGGGDFAGNSVRICGSRTPPADSKFRCTNDLAAADAGPESCPCFNFDSNGNLIDVTTGQASELTDLCPSVDPAAGPGEDGA